MAAVQRMHKRFTDLPLDARGRLQRDTLVTALHANEHGVGLSSRVGTKRPLHTPSACLRHG